MKKIKIFNKKYFSFSLVIVMLFSLIGFFAFFITKINVNNVAISEKDNSEFKNNRAIIFTNFDKFFIIEYSDEKPKFNIQNFEILFIQKFIKLEPLENETNLFFSSNNPESSTEIQVNYKNKKDKELFWDYKINF